MGQVGSMQAVAQVDVPNDLPNDTQQHTLKWFNFSAAVDIATPVMINVLPHVGDGASLSARAPSSTYNGALSLTAAPVVTFSDGSLPNTTDPFQAVGTIYYSADTASSINHNPDQNTSDWCSLNGVTFTRAPGSGNDIPAAGKWQQRD